MRLWHETVLQRFQNAWKVAKEEAASGLINNAAVTYEMAASSGLDGAAHVASTPASAEENEHIVPNSNESESRSRFGLNLSITELLQNWGILNLSPFRRKSSKPSTPSPSSQSPQKQPSPPVNSDSENIELVQLSNIKVSDALWKNVHSKIGMSGDVFFSNMPVMVTSKALSQQLEAEQRQSHSESDTDSQHSYVEQLSSRLKEEDEVDQGIGHNFNVTESSYPTWCDRCGDLLWGLYESHYLRCSYCHYTCHPQCHGLVTLDCRGDMASSEKEENQVGLEEIQDPGQEPMLIEDEECSSFKVSQEELQQFIFEYNACSPSGLDMTLEEDGSTFRGFIRVHMNLSRPISVVAGTRPPSIYDILKDDETLEKTLTSFYLPRDTVKALHVTSETTTHEVIKALLKKFKVVDNPGKFALYERYYEQEETAKVKMRRISENEKPLVLALRWSREKNCNKMFVLQENDTGDILWEAFSLPELNNFLKILDREEEEYKKMVRHKYEIISRKIQEAMDRLQSSTPSKVPQKNTQYDAHFSSS